MITTTQTHIDLLNTRSFWAVDLYALTFLDGSTLRLLGSTGGLSTRWQGELYQGGGPILTRESVRLARGLEADDLTLTISPKPDDLLLGLPWREAVQNGALDGGRVTLYRAHAPAPGDPIVGAILKFAGPVNAWKIEDEIVITIKSDLAQLDRKTPRAVYGPGCDRTLFDAGCGVNRLAYQVNASVAQGSTTTLIKTALAAPAAYYAGGEIRFSSGLNAGARRTVKQHGADGTLTLTYPLNRAVSIGDAFVIWPGCSRRKDETGCMKFNNLSRFRGQPFVPVPETAF